MKKYIILTLLIVLGVLAGCGKKEEVAKEDVYVRNVINVGFSQLGAESDWRVANTESMKSSLSLDKDFNLLFDDAQQKQDKQIMAIRKFIQQEVDCIVLAPVTETGWDTVLKEAKDAKIPVIVTDRMVDVEDDSLYTAWVGSDFFKEGRIACEWLKRYAELEGIEPSELNIVDIQGTLGATSQIGRSNALSESAAENGWKLLESVPADYAQTKAKEVMQQLLRKHSDINVVYCENDNEAIGVIEAIEEAGKTAGSDINSGDILVISFDAAHSGLNMVLEGKIALDVECNPLQGEEVAWLIRDVTAGKDVEKYTYIEESVFSTYDKINGIVADKQAFDVTILTQEILDGRKY
ncbi:MAG: ABC transporter substrate-binding protein [Lachnospiraceae bacterium]|nr:ABC transporter substrate-binding protein [Lachnospiraceae bacterium]